MVKWELRKGNVIPWAKTRPSLADGINWKLKWLPINLPNAQMAL